MSTNVCTENRSLCPLTSIWFCKMLVLLVFRSHTRKLLIFTHRSKRFAGKFCQVFMLVMVILSSSTGTVGSCLLLCNKWPFNNSNLCSYKWSAIFCHGPSHRVRRVLSFFSSRRNWDSPNPSPARECPPPFGSGGRPERMLRSRLRKLTKLTEWGFV
jgi:hypothetical protein